MVRCDILAAYDSEGDCSAEGLDLDHGGALAGQVRTVDALRETGGGDSPGVGRAEVGNAEVRFCAVKFEVISPFRATEVIASGRGIRILSRLVRLYGRGQWRKMKGIATVRFEDGRIAEAELHWFEAHGIGKRKLKIKRLIDTT